MVATAKPEGNLKLESGWLCLDFANTADWHLSDHPTERLTSYARLVAWARSIGLLPDRTAQQLLRAAEQRPAEAARVLERAVALREAIFHIFETVAGGHSPTPADQTTLNAELGRSLARSRLVWNQANFDWGRDEDDALDQVLWWVLRSSTNLLTSEDIRRVGVCADDRGCGWLFYDTSRNRTRQWCSMRGCGNRAKAKRHYEKVRSEE
jgi:predicted RNA-binding Zn ribbon-like protein